MENNSTTSKRFLTKKDYLHGKQKRKKLIYFVITDYQSAINTFRKKSIEFSLKFCINDSIKSVKRQFLSKMIFTPTHYTITGKNSARRQRIIFRLESSLRFSPS